MPKAIVWSDNAKLDVTELVSYLTMNWGEKITNGAVRDVSPAHLVL